MGSQDEICSIYETAVRLAYDAGRLLRDRVGRHGETSFKGAIDLVTEVDRGAEALIAQGISAAHPGHAMLGEEGTTTGVELADAEWVWVVDPIDGTTNFAHAYPHFAVSIAITRRGIGEIGVVYDPSRDELFAASRGGPATLNGRAIHVSTVATLARSLLGTGFSYDIARQVDQHALWSHFNMRTQGIRREGSAALGVVWVAAGRMDGFYEQPINAWDVGAGAVIVTAAGGAVTSLDGSPYDVFGQEILVSNGRIHEELVASMQVARLSEPILGV